MARIRNLPRAPIQEALMDLQFRGPEATIANLEAAVGPLKAEGWLVERVDTVSATFGPLIAEAEEPSVKAYSKQFEALSAKSPDDNEIIQLRPSRLTVARVTRYGSWDDLYGRTQQVFGLMTAQFGPEAVTRVAARYINRIPPDPRYSTFSDIMTRPPQPLELEGLEGGRIENFLRRHVVTDLPGGFTANFSIGTVTPMPTEDASKMNPLLIDIDVFKRGEFAIDFGEIGAQLGEIRPIKNALFFGSLKEEGVEQFS